MRPLAVIVPTLSTPGPLARLLAELADWEQAAARPLLVFVIDDGSEIPLQRTAPAPRGLRLFRHAVNRGYGGAQKTGYAAALANGCETLVLLHGDGQYDTAANLALGPLLEQTGAEVALGSRFLPGGPPTPAPAWRRLGNHALTQLANRRFGVALSELHTGARAYAASALSALPFDRYSDDYLFDHQVLAAFLADGARFVEAPVSARYDETVRSISPSRALRYGLGCLGTLLRPPRARVAQESPRRGAQRR